MYRNLCQSLFRLALPEIAATPQLFCADHEPRDLDAMRQHRNTIPLCRHIKLPSHPMPLSRRKLTTFSTKGLKSLSCARLPEHQNKRQQSPHWRLQHHPDQHCQIDKISKHLATSPPAKCQPVLNRLWERNRKPAATRLHRVF